MADVKKIINVTITRETKFPSSDSFGIGGVMASFSPGNLNTPMQGATGRYKKYVSLAVMVQDGWEETDPVYTVAEAYFGNKKNPRNFIVGLRKDTDADWAATLDAIQAENDDWYGFTCILSDTELATPAALNSAIEAIADWTEDQVKLFGYTTSQKGCAGELVLLSAGYFTSGKPGALANFQAVENGFFNISRNSATAILVKDINLSSGATEGQWQTGSLSGNLASFQETSDGEFSITLNGGSAIDVAGIDTSSVGNFAAVASVIQAAVQAADVSLASVTVVYDSSVGKLLFTSPTTGATSTVVIAVAGTPSGTDFTGADFMNGGVSEPGDAAAVVASLTDVASILQTAVQAADASLSSVTVEYDSDNNRFVFTSDTTGDASSIEITTDSGESGEDLTGSDYLNGGIRTWGTAAGATPGTDDLGTFLKGKYDRTFWIFHENAYDAPHVDIADVVWFESAWMSFMFGSYDPAEATWAFKQLGDNDKIVVSEITDTQDEFIRGNNGNTYTLTGGADITLDGKVCGGEYIDIMRGTDWLQARLVEGAYAPLLDNPKVAFTDPGIGLEENAIRGVLAEAEVNLLAAGETVLIVPKAADITKAEKAARTANGFEFTGVYQGAIQKVGIAGTIGV